MQCFDMNRVSLRVGNIVVYTQNGDDEDEGTVTELLPNNRIKMNGENGTITVNASDCLCIG